MSITPGEELLIKIWETLEKGVTGLIRPWQEKRVGKAFNDIKADEIKKIANAEKDAEKIKTGEFLINPQGKVISFPQQPKTLPKDTQIQTIESSIQNEGVNPNTIELLRTAATRDQYLKLRREINLRKIAIHAFDEAQSQDNDEVADEPVDPGWFYQWQEKAQNIQQEDLQKLWAKTLTGEVKKPGSYSLFTLDFLSKLTKDDAETISKIAKYKLDHGDSHFVYNPSDKFFEERGLKYSVLLELENLGILNLGGGLGLSFQWGPSPEDETNAIITNLNRIIILKIEASKKVSIKQLQVTNVGNEIMNLGKFDIDQDYLDLLIKDFKNQGCKVFNGENLKKSGPTWGATILNEL